MDDRHAKPGDIIKIFDDSDQYRGREALVVGWPWRVGYQCRGQGEVCCLRHDDTDGFYTASQYTIVKRGETQQEAQPEVRVDKPSKTLRDDIFRSIFE